MTKRLPLLAPGGSLRISAQCLLLGGEAESICSTCVPLPHERCGPYAGWRLADAPAEPAIEMGNITKADRKRNVDDRQVQLERVTHHREGTLKPPSCQVLG